MRIGIIKVGVACCYFCMPQNSDLVPVCACALVQILENRLRDDCFNYKQVSDVYCNIINIANL